MKRDTWSGVLLIVGTLVTVLALLQHPSGLLGAGEHFAREARMAIGVHAIVIAMTVVVFFGFYGLNRRLAATPDLGTAGLVAFGVAVVGVMVAAAVSGFAGTALAERYRAADESTRQILHQIFHYNGVVNQAFAKMHLVASATAILLWSVAILRSGAVPRAVGFLGLAVGLGTLVGLLIGPVILGVHTVFLYAFGQGAWTVWIGVEMVRGERSI